MAATRGRWALRDRPGLVWLALAAVVALGHHQIESSRWLMVHLVALGALTHSVMVWSSHFTDALLKNPPDLESRRRQSWRLALLQAGVALVMVGVPTAWWWLTLAGGLLVGAAVLWHATMLVVRLRRTLPARFTMTVRYYVSAALLLPVGITLGVLLARGPSDLWHGRMLVAHTMVNLLGWVGLTVLGTVLTLWPTMLHTRMPEGSDTRSRRTLPVLVLAVLAVATGALLGTTALALAGLAAYLLAVLFLLRDVLAAARQRTPWSFATWSAGAGLVWLVLALLLVIATVARTGSWAGLRHHYGAVTTAFVVGFALQVLMGAMSHLLPSVLGGGPSVVRAGTAELGRFGLGRVVIVNSGLVVCLLPVASWVRVLVSSLVLLTLIAFIPLVFRGIRASVRARIALARSGPETLTLSQRRDAASAAHAERASTPALPVWQSATALALVALLTAVGSALGDTPLPGVGGSSQPAAAAVAPTGQTTRVTVRAKDMRFEPASVDVPVGNRLEVTLVNSDDTTAHDLVLANGADTGRIAPREQKVLDAGVIGSDVEGWCSVVGHKQMGMRFDVRAVGAAGGASAASAQGTGGSSSASGHSAHGGGATGASAQGTAAAALDLGKKPGAGFTAYDAALPPLTSERTHRVRLEVIEKDMEVAPGVVQKRWTFNGQVPGPVLHGRVGDTFEVTLVNKGTMGHSIDFHAGVTPPDRAMRTIPPGESLVYRFTATRAGIWMYHCSTMPMSAHIAAGMHGAVIIEPDGLPQVDRSYVLVQSELYLGNQGEAVNADKVMARQPDAMAFNGYAAQYDHQPLTARPGERVRFWVLDAGPNRSSSFHVVGGQFDTVFHEGAYSLKRGRDAFGGADGGSQALGLQAAQGGFVELVLPEAGTYPFVSHSMVDAERGAHGYLKVAP